MMKLQFLLMFAIAAALAPTAHAGTGSDLVFQRALKSLENRSAAATAWARMTPLQKHVAFFDRNGDFVITMSETGESLKMLGFGGLESKGLAVAIHAALGPATSRRLSSEIHMANIIAGRHGSDTGVYDTRGFFVSEAFERMFASFDTNRSGSLSEPEIGKMIEANAARRPGGRLAARLEFALLFRIATDGIESQEGTPVRSISRSQMQRFYDGSLFYQLAGMRL